MNAPNLTFRNFYEMPKCSSDGLGLDGRNEAK